MLRRLNKNAGGANVGPSSGRLAYFHEKKFAFRTYISGQKNFALKMHILVHKKSGLMLSPRILLILLF
jgi:hypothetical protein